MARNQRLPLAVVPLLRLPALSLLPRDMPAPRGQMVLVRELVHVDPDLGDERLGGGLTDVGNPIQQRNDLGEKAHFLLDLLIKIGDETVERLDMCPVQAQHEAMMRGDVIVERLQQ